MGRFLYGPILMLAVGVADAAALAQPVAPRAEPVAQQSETESSTETPELMAPGLPSPTPDSLSTDNGSLAEGDGSPSTLIPLTDVPATDNAVEQNSSRALGDFWGYRTAEYVTSWMAGDGNQFGDYSLGLDHYERSGITSGIGVGIELHFLAGPEVTDMPPRVFNFSLGYQQRKEIGSFVYDVSAAVMAASDFEGSSRRGIRFPAHAVGYYVVDPELDLALGADFLDREDIHILPVAGFIWRPDPDVRVELLFPRPRIDFQLREKFRLFLRGGLGGGTWAVERVGGADDLATYYDLQIGVGLEGRNAHGWQSFEIAYLFDRKLEYASQVGDYQPAETVMIRTVSSY